VEAAQKQLDITVQNKNLSV